MKLNAELRADSRTPYQSITACGADHVAVNGRVLQRSLLLMPEQLIEDWGPASFSALTPAHIEMLARMPWDVLLLGTGQRQHFPSPALLRPIYETGRGAEIMDTPAACRTYNLLASEGRLVCAALIIESSGTA
ncbi:Mth938-like domain-containing protein [Rhodocyclaceae bacterium]